MASFDVLPPDRAVIALAAGQHSVVTSKQMAAAGLTRHAVAHRVDKGWLTCRHRGVYQVGPLAAPLAREMAAVLACGPQAVVSHRSAAALWAICAPQGGPVDILLLDAHGRQRKGIQVHHGRVSRAEVSSRQGIPLTTPARALLDLAASRSLPARELARMIEEAQVQRLVTPAQLHALRGRGANTIQALINDSPSLTRSEAERRLLALIRAARLPHPQTNVRVAGHEVDLLWPAQRLIVEVDGYAYHHTRAAFERDRARDAQLAAAGYRVIRITWRRLHDEPEAVVARPAALAS